jgi:hypothetical protein
MDVACPTTKTGRRNIIDFIDTMKEKLPSIPRVSLCCSHVIALAV